MKLSLVLSTVNRPTLDRTLRSIKQQEQGPDEILFIIDGKFPDAEMLCRSYNLPANYVYLDGPHNDWGNAARCHGTQIAAGDYIHYVDDDDHFHPDAFKIIRQRIAETGHGPHIFRMDGAYNHWGDRAVTVGGRIALWGKPDLVVGNVSTQMIVFPNDPNKKPKWGKEYWADCIFIQAVCAHYPKVFWHEDIIAAWNH